MTAADVIAERAAWAIEQRDATALPWPLPDGSVATIVTSPPYWGLRDYGVAGQLGLERDPQEYVEHLVAVFREARRVLDHYGTLWLNLGDTFYTAKGSCWNPGGSSMSIHQERVTAGAVPHARNAPNRMMPTSRAAELGLNPKRVYAGGTRGWVGDSPSEVVRWRRRRNSRRGRDRAWFNETRAFVLLGYRRPPRGNAWTAFRDSGGCAGSRSWRGY